MFEIITDLFKKRKIVFTPIDESKIKDNEIVKAQQQKIAAQEAQLSRMLVHEKQKREKEQSKDKDKEKEKKFFDQKQELDSIKHGKIIWLDKFFYQLFLGKPAPRGHISNHYSNWGQRLEICDKNDEVVLGNYGGIGIMEGGKLCLRERNGELVSYGKSLHHVFSKPDAFENMARRGRFLIPMDKDGNWMEDFEYKEMKEPEDFEYDEETGQVKKIIWSKIKTNEVKKIIARIAEEKNSLAGELEMRDSVVIKLKHKIDEISRKLKIYENQSDTAQTELSKAIEKTMSIERNFANVYAENAKLLELKSTYESLIIEKDKVIDKVLSKLDTSGDLKSDRLKAELKDDLEFYKAILPERVEITEEAPKEPKELVKPGQVLR